MGSAVGGICKKLCRAGERGNQVGEATGWAGNKVLIKGEVGLVVGGGGFWRRVGTSTQWSILHLKHICAQAKVPNPLRWGSRRPRPPS